ncbi:MAG: TIGR04283 family arsenosugar biosynthesis glycosyltransferase [Sedimentisphaerales bacterium]|nr:TIGR04283 family arsenosugar biosynthesis glycosyltransferase [Sedimentisphaerales bacterium]
MPSPPAKPNECRLSVIVPVLDEQEQINACLDHLRGQGLRGRREIIVVDGDPHGGTVALIRDAEVIRLTGARGRARQMNAGASVAHGEILLFLHADTRLPDSALEKISSVMAAGTCVAGAFDLGIDSDRWILRHIAFRASVRSRISRIPYGDQAIFIDRTFFEGLGGFAEMPIMEDVDLMRRIKRSNRKIHIFRDKVLTSPRRWEAEGALYTTLRNQMLMLCYYLGVRPETLIKLYKPQKEIRRTQSQSLRH